MSGTIDKAHFLRNDWTTYLRKIPANAEPKWGKMNPQQMVEHMAYSLRQASGKEKYELVTEEQYVPKMQAFLMSEKEFKENTPNQLLPDTPPAPKHDTIEASIKELQDEIEHFFEVFAKEPSLKLTNPFFGELGYEQWVQLLHKHAWHHLKQFGIIGE